MYECFSYLNLVYVICSLGFCLLSLCCCAQIHFTAVDIFTNKKMDCLEMSTANVEVPYVQRTEYTLIDINEDFLSLMDGDANTRQDIRYVCAVVLCVPFFVTFHRRCFLFSLSLSLMVFWYQHLVYGEPLIASSCCLLV